MNIAILLSGGTGARLGGNIPKQYIEVGGKPVIIYIPKQYIEVGGKPVIIYCLQTLNRSKLIDKIQIVASDEWVPKINAWTKKFGVDSKICGYSNPGKNRQLSIYNGLVDIKSFVEDDDNIFIHDAARPNLSLSTIETTFEAIKGYDGVIPVLPMKDTVYLSKDGLEIDSLLKRQEIFAGQAPETFVYGKYIAANQKLVDSGEIIKINGSTEPAVKAGMKIHMIAGDEFNFKITTIDDLERFKEQIKAIK